MLLFNLSSNTDISLSLLLVIFSDSLSSIFFISSSILFELVDGSTWNFDIVAVISLILFWCVSSILGTFDRSGSELRLLLVEWFSPVGLLLFLFLLLMLSTVCPCKSLIFLPLLGSDILHTTRRTHYCMPLNSSGSLIMTSVCLLMLFSLESWTDMSSLYLAIFWGNPLFPTQKHILFSSLWLMLQFAFQKCRMICYPLNYSMAVVFLFQRCSTMICFLCYFGIHVVSCISFIITQSVKFFREFLSIWC